MDDTAMIDPNPKLPPSAHPDASSNTSDGPPGQPTADIPPTPQPDTHSNPDVTNTQSYTYRPIHPGTIRVLPITATLDSLLRRLRERVYPDSRLLWADAVCINQDDPVEKGVHVGLMRAVYSGARRVIVDLGEESDNLEEALTLMAAWWRKHVWLGIHYGKQSLPPDLTALFMGFESCEIRERRRWEAVELPGFRHRRWNAVRNLFRRPWFSRMWVVQEFFLAREVAFICGQRDIPWQDIVGVTLVTCEGSMLSVGTGDTQSWWRMMAFATLAYQWRMRCLRSTPKIQAWLGTGNPSYNLPLLGLLTLFHVLSTTRRRDKYYALIGIATDVAVDEPDLRPDYISPIGTVVSRAGSFLWKRGHGVASLLGGGLVQRSSNMQGPTWVLNFTETTGHFGMFQTPEVTYAAAGDTPFHATTIPELPHLVTLSGVFVDVVNQDPRAEMNRAALSRLLGDRGEDESDERITRLLYDHLSLIFRGIFDDITSVVPLPDELSDKAVTAAFYHGSLDWDRSELGRLATAREQAIGFRATAWMTAQRDVFGGSNRTQASLILPSPQMVQGE